MSTPLIISNLIIGPLLLALSLIFKAFPPRKINWLYGYRTKRSMKSQETWNAANQYSLDMMLWTGVITTALQVILYLIFEPATVLLTAATIMCVLLLAQFLVIERYLKKNFDSEGKRISK